MENRDVSCGTYVELLQKWNSKINLIAKSTVDCIEERHIRDSAQLLKYMSKDDKVIDLGSGAGFPGVVLSVFGVRDVTLIESDVRKAAFLFEVKRLLSGEFNILNDRIEEIEDLVCDVITSRAFAELSKIFEYSRKIVVNDKYLLHKGENYQKEIENANKDWLFDVDIHDSLTSSKGKILEIRNVKPR